MNPGTPRASAHRRSGEEAVRSAPHLLLRGRRRGRCTGAFGTRTACSSSSSFSSSSASSTGVRVLRTGGEAEKREGAVVRVARRLVRSRLPWRLARLGPACTGLACLAWA